MAYDKNYSMESGPKIFFHKMFEEKIIIKMKTKLLFADLYSKIGKVNFEIFQEQQNTDFWHLNFEFRL